MTIKRMLTKITGIIVVSGMLVATIGAGEALARKRPIGHNGGGYAGAPVKATDVSIGYIDFGAVSVGVTTPSVAVTLTSTGTADVTLAADAALSGIDPGQYVMTAGTCTAGTVLAPGATCTASVQFSPSISGTFGASADFSTDAVIPMLQVTQTGTGV